MRSCKNGKKYKTMKINFNKRYSYDKYISGTFFYEQDTFFSDVLNR